MTARTRDDPEARPGTPAAPPLPLAADLGERPFSRPWMHAWAEAASAAPGVASACAAADASLAEFNDARRDDPEFDDLCSLHREAVDHRIADKLLADALGGDARGLALYFHHLRDILGRADDPSARKPIPGPVAEAMIRAGLAAVEAARR